MAIPGGPQGAVFYKIHSGTVSLDKDKYLTPAPNLQRTRASHDLQYTRYFAYNDALKNSFFPRTIPLWYSLPSSVVSSKTIEEFKVGMSSGVRISERSNHVPKSEPNVSIRRFE